MTIQWQTAGIDELLDHAGDAVARSDWALAKELAEAVLQRSRSHPEAELVLRTANAYQDSDRPAHDPLSSSRDLRFMSIMFCDIVRSTQLARQLGDAHWRDTLERFRRRCARAVRRYDGYIHEATGDELLILFGYPRVREDDARRSVLAGLDIVSAIQALSGLLERERGVTLKVRVGIHTGRALIKPRSPNGDASRSDAALGGGLVGEAAHIAKRIETAAAANTVWISGPTSRIVEGFFELEASQAGRRDVALDSGPAVEAYQVNGPTAALNRHQIARLSSDEFVGRRAERDRLLELWAQAKTTGAPFVVVAGPAGIGKSRLVEYLADTAAGSTASRLECVCTEILKPVAFAPLVGVLQRIANIRQADSPDIRLSKLHAAFRQLSPEFAELVPYLAWMMSIPRAGSGDIDELGPEIVRPRIFDCLLKALTLAGSIRPLVFWIDDVQWADHSTLEFCQRLQEHGPIPGLLVVATMRTDFAGMDARLPWSAAEREAGSVITIELDALSRDESRRLIATRLGSQTDDAVVNAVLDSTGGNPLYIEEVVRSAGGEAVRTTAGGKRSAIPIPETLQPIFAQIVDRLGQDRHIAQMSSLLGRELPEPLTRAVIASILGLSEDAVVAGLARLIDLDIVEPLLTELTRGYRFRHDLIREALAHSVGSDAKENHGRIASVIERSFPEHARDRPALLAYHFVRAEQYDKAAAYWFAAGLALQARAAHTEAIAAFDDGLDALSRIVAQAGAPARTKLEVSLHASRGVSLQTIRGYTDPEAGRDWARAHELSREIGAEGALVPALGGLWSFHFVRGAHTFVRDLRTTSIQVAEQILDAAGDDPEAQLTGYVCLGYAQYFKGLLNAGRASTERSWALREQVKNHPPHIHLPQDPGLAALSLLGPVRWSVGDQVGGTRAADDAVALAAALESKRAINLARIGQTNAWLHQIRRDHEKALRAADQALTVAKAFHIGWAVVNLSIHKGLAMAHLNETDDSRQDAVRMVRENLAYWRAGGAETMVPYFLGELAEAHHRAGEDDVAFGLLESAIELGESNDEHFHDAELFRIRGEVNLASPSGVAAGVDDLRRAVAKAREQHATSFEIRSIVSLLTAVRDLPDRATWIVELEQAIEDLQSSEHGQDEREARTLIAQERRGEVFGPA